MHLQIDASIDHHRNFGRPIALGAILMAELPATPVPFRSGDAAVYSDRHSAPSTGNGDMFRTPRAPEGGSEQADVSRETSMPPAEGAETDPEAAEPRDTGRPPFLPLRAAASCWRGWHFDGVEWAA